MFFHIYVEKFCKKQSVGFGKFVRSAYNRNEIRNGCLLLWEKGDREAVDEE